MTMKNIYIFLLILTTAIPAMSQQMIVEKGSNSESIDFANLDKITFSGSTVKIVQSDGTTSQAAMGDITRIRFSNYSNIGHAGNTKENLLERVSNEEIAINCDAGAIVSIYDTTGSQRICMRLKSDNGTISIAHLPKGIYIIKVDNRTAKFLKR